MSAFADTPEPPYWAVIFSNRRTGEDEAAYAETAARMVELARAMPGFLGVETASDPRGLTITVSYWESEEAIAGWRRHAEHEAARRQGNTTWYAHYELRVARVERAYDGPRR